MVHEVVDVDEFQKLLKDAGDKLVVVDFYASWCGPCKHIGPIFKGLSEDPAYADVIFLKVNVDEANDVSESCEIRSMPTFQFYKNNKKVHEFSGADEATLKAKLAELK